MKFSTVPVIAAVASSASAAYLNTTSLSASTTETIHKTTITVTSCHDNKCTAAPVVTGVTTVTENETTYVTYCPLTAEEAKELKSLEAASAVEDIIKTTITVTSCYDNMCTKSPVVTGLTTVTENETTYVTYCPLTAEKAKELKSAAAEASTSTAPLSKAPNSKAPVSAANTKSSSASHKTSTSPSVVVPGNAANGLKSSGIAAAFIAVISFIM